MRSSPAAVAEGARAAAARAARTQPARAARQAAAPRARGCRGRRRRAADASAAPHEGGTHAADLEPSVDALLDWLEANGYLSPTRFAEARVHARAARFGNRAHPQELAQPRRRRSTPSAQRGLRETELARARAVWQRKFGSAAPDAAEPRQTGALSRRSRLLGEVIRARASQGLPEGD